MSSPDYVGFDPDAAIEDFKERIRKYTDAYEPLDSVLDKEFTWLKVYNVDERYEANRIEGLYIHTCMYVRTSYNMSVLYVLCVYMYVRTYVRSCFYIFRPFSCLYIRTRMYVHIHT